MYREKARTCGSAEVNPNPGTRSRLVSEKERFAPRVSTWGGDPNPSGKGVAALASPSPGDAVLELLRGLIVDGDGHPGVGIEGELHVVMGLRRAGLSPRARRLLSASRKPPRLSTWREASQRSHIYLFA